MTALLSVLVFAGTLSAPSFLSAPAPAVCPGAPASVEQAQFDGGVIAPTVQCSVTCGLFQQGVSCSGATCSAVQRSCHAEVGHVTCDGNTYYCGPCCTDGTIKIVSGGPACSCPNGGSPRDRYLCVDGEWEYQFTTCGIPCSG